MMRKGEPTMRKREEGAVVRTRKFLVGLATVILGVGIIAACGSDSNSSSAGLACSTSLPSGSFAASCTGCSMRGTVLACTECGDGSGGTPRASIDTCTCSSAEATQGISNNHGVLECGSGAPATGGGKCSPGSGECKNCKCGQSCFPTAVCSTCTARCGYSCVTDQDCKDLQSKFNLTVGYTHCVKTSPNYDIYKCE